MNNNIQRLVYLFSGIDRYTKKSNIPNGFKKLKKEIFTDGNIVIKYTNFKKNKGIDSYVYENEAKYLFLLQKFKFIPKFYGMYKKDNNIYLVMEYINGTSLDNLSIMEWFFLKNRIDIFEEKLKYIIAQFRLNNLVHRDIRPHNLILLKSKDSLDLKIIDFQYMINIETNMDLSLLNSNHYSNVLNNIGGIWRNKEIKLNSFENDEYAMRHIVNNLRKETIVEFFIKKLKGVIS